MGFARPILPRHAPAPDRSRKSGPGFFRDLQTAKAMSMLGPAAFGPVCSACGRHKTEYMPEHFAEYVTRKLGHPIRHCECEERQP